MGSVKSNSLLTSPSLFSEGTVKHELTFSQFLQDHFFLIFSAEFYVLDRLDKRNNLRSQKEKYQAQTVCSLRAQSKISSHFRSPRRALFSDFFSLILIFGQVRQEKQPTESKGKISSSKSWRSKWQVKNDVTRTQPPPEIRWTLGDPPLTICRGKRPNSLDTWIYIRAFVQMFSIQYCTSLMCCPYF